MRRANTTPARLAPLDVHKPLLRLQGITVRFALGSGGVFQKRRTHLACDSVDLDILPGEIVGLVGESGSGKSTLGRAAVLLQRPDAGEVRFRDRNLSGLSSRDLREVRSGLQMVFQDPRSSLNPRWRAARSILRPLRINGLGSWPDEKTALAQVLTDVELGMDIAERYPHALSGGQAQRVCIARALVLRPALVIADEALSGLDVTTQASVLALMMRLRQEHGTAFLFISHDLRTVRSISDRVAVMSEGRIVEFRPTAELFDNPRDKYTRRLLTDVIHTHNRPQLPA